MAEAGEHFTADTAEAQRNRAALEEHLQAEANHDLERTLGTMVLDPTFALNADVVAQGRQAIDRLYRTRFSDVPDQRFVVTRSLVTDTVAVIEGFMTGTPARLFFGHPAYGKPIRVPATVWIPFRDGKLAGEYAYFDSAELARQLREGCTSHEPL